jgi:hypothetical protein
MAGPLFESPSGIAVALSHLVIPPNPIRPSEPIIPPNPIFGTPPGMQIFQAHFGTFAPTVDVLGVADIHGDTPLIG